MHCADNWLFENYEMIREIRQAIHRGLLKPYEHKLFVQSCNILNTIWVIKLE